MDSPASSTPASTKEIEIEFPDIIRVYKDGTVERLFGSPTVPPSLPDPTTQVSSKDITISHDPSISARLYLPNTAQSNPHHKLPILVYFHAGAYCLESAFSFLHHRYLNLIASKCNVIAVSIEYRQAPEHPLPAAYEDSWESLKWVSSHAHATTSTNPQHEKWLVQHGDFNRVYIGGDSAGGNIVHNIAMQCGSEELPGGVKLLGCFLSCPYFWGSEPVGKEPKGGHEKNLGILLWNLVYPSAVGGVDNPAINPMVEGAPSLARLGCEKLFVVACEKDPLRERDVLYCEAVKKSGWKGEVEWLEVEGEDHCFDFFTPETDNATKIFDRLVSFLV